MIKTCQSYRKMRKEVVTFARFHKGHTYRTNSNLLKGEDPPFCVGSHAPFTVKHIFMKGSSKHYHNIVDHNLKELFLNRSIEIIFLDSQKKQGCSKIYKTPNTWNHFNCARKICALLILKTMLPIKHSFSNHIYIYIYTHWSVQTCFHVCDSHLRGCCDHLSFSSLFFSLYTRYLS